METFLQMVQPIHPKLVHFPIALIFSAMGLQALGMVFNSNTLCKSAWIMFMVAVIFMPIVVLSGLWEANRMNLHHPVLDLHKKLAFYVLWSSLAGLVILPIIWLLKGDRFFRVMFLILLVLITGVLTFAAHQGGRMVYEYGVGVSQ